MDSINASDFWDFIFTNDYKLIEVIKWKRKYAKGFLSEGEYHDSKIEY